MLKFTLVILLVASGAFAADIIEFKNGMSFNHKGHQVERVGKCSVCHDNVSVSKDETKVSVADPGKISGFGKVWAHKNCTDCHDLFGEGPVKCNDCHHTRVSSIN